MTPAGGSSAIATAERPRERSRAGFRQSDAIRVDHRVALAGIVLFAIVLRFVDIGSTLSIDDGYSWLVGSAPTAHTFLHRLAGSENTPPLFYLLLTPLPLHHEAWLRMPAAIPGVLMCLALYVMLRKRLGVAVGAARVASRWPVSPFLVTYSNIARGFMLADLALLGALAAILELLDGGSRRWWLVYIGCAVVAIYTEYDSAIFLLSLTAVAVALSKPGQRPAEHRRCSAAPRCCRSSRGSRRSSTPRTPSTRPSSRPTFGGPSLTALRDSLVSLAFGEHGGTANPAGRWLELAVIVAIAALAAAMILRQRAGQARAAPRPQRRAIIVIAASVALTFVGHAIVGAIGVHVFNQRYLTLMIPLVAALLAAAVLATGRPPAADRRLRAACAPSGSSTPSAATTISSSPTWRRCAQPRSPCIQGRC